MSSKSSQEETQNAGKSSSWSISKFLGRGFMSRMKKEPVQKVKERHVFGIPLEYVMESSGHEYGVPLIVYQCINELTYAIDEVGLYRIPGSNLQVETLRDKYDYLEPVDLTGENPNTIATLLKLYLRKLPNRLIDDEHTMRLNEIIRKYNVEKPEDFTHFNEVAEVLEDLPGWEYNLIGYICFHLKSVADNAEYNKMNINNLGLIFCPTLKIAPAVFSILVIHSQRVFRRFLSSEEAYENEDDYNTDYTTENDETEDNTHTNDHYVDDKEENNNTEVPTEETNLNDDLANNEELLKVNDQFDDDKDNVQDQEQKADENTSDTLISLEEENANTNVNENEVKDEIEINNEVKNEVEIDNEVSDEVEINNEANNEENNEEVEIKNENEVNDEAKNEIEIHEEEKDENENINEIENKNVDENENKDEQNDAVEIKDEVKNVNELKNENEKVTEISS